MRTRVLTACVAATIAAIVFASNGLAQGSAKDEQLVRGATAQIVSAKTKARGYVLEFKASSFKDSSPEYTQARRLYVEAQSQFAGWASYLKSAIADNQTRDLQKDQTYFKLSKDAGVSAQSFVTFVEDKTGASKAILPAISGLADLGLKVWNGIKDREAKDRATRADAFAKDVQWEDWDKIK
jgi:hypothetical protein